MNIERLLKLAHRYEELAAKLNHVKQELAEILSAQPWNIQSVKRQRRRAKPSFRRRQSAIMKARWAKMNLAERKEYVRRATVARVRSFQAKRLGKL